MRLRASLFVFVFTAAIIGCDAFIGANGTVLDTTGKRLPGAAIRLTWGDQVMSVESDSAGHFEATFAHGVGSSKPGSVVICKDGYLSSRVDFVAADTILNNLEFRLAPDTERSTQCR
jgi:hypothetical protein